MDQNLIVPFLLFNENQQWNLVFGWGEGAMQLRSTEMVFDIP